MTAYKLVVLSNPAAGRENEYNDWYTETHLSDVLRIPGIKSAQRLAFDRLMGGAQPPQRYLAIYDVETDDPDTVIAELVRRAGTDAMRISDAMAPDAQAVLYRKMVEQRA